MKRKLYSFINIFGLATGVAVCLVILKYVDFQLSYDDYHTNASSIYRTVTTHFRNGELRGKNPLSGFAQGPSLLADIPEIKTYIRTHPVYGGAVVTYNPGTSSESVQFHEEKGQYVDSTFLDVFTYTPIEGNLSTALDHPNSMVVTRKFAKRYFKTESNVVGKMLSVSGGFGSGEYHVTAVIDDVPENSHLEFDYLMPMHDALINEQYKNDDGWGWENFYSYVQFHSNVDPKVVESKMPAFIEKYRGKDLASSGSTQVLTFQPIRQIHLSPGLEEESSATISMNTIYFFLIISIFILAIAWVNYINLSTARAMERAREVGIKKAVGAFRYQLITQFAFESVVVNFLATVLALVIAVSLLPLLGSMVEKNFQFDFTDPRLWMVLSILFLFGSFVSGAYPAFVLSSFNTSAVLKGGEKNTSDGFSLRKALVVFQFVSSLVLIAGTFTIYRQIMFMRGQDKGLTMEQMLIINGPRILEQEGSQERLVSFREQLKTLSSVKNVTSSGSIPGGGFNWGTTMRKVGDPAEMNKSGNVTWVDPDFIDTYNLQLVAGRKWNADIASDREAMIINEAALTAFGLGTAEEALTKQITLGGDTVTILGVLKNYHWNSLKTAHVPILLAPATVSRSKFSILIGGNSMQSTIKQVEKIYNDAFPGNPFDYYFLDDFFDKQYKDDQQFASIFGMFAILAIIIACLGLWGLASFTTNQKLREISIRKVLGATTSSIVSLLSGQFMKLVLIASLISIPLIWYGIDTWLDNFAFRISIGWELFVIPALILAVIALVTVSFQILKGANSNPAKILRSE